VLSPRFLTFVFPLQDLVLALCLVDLVAYLDKSRSKPCRPCHSHSSNPRCLHSLHLWSLHLLFTRLLRPSLKLPIRNSLRRLLSPICLVHPVGKWTTTTMESKGLTSIRKVAVVACMDSRLDVEKVLGLDIGDAHVIRNGNHLQYLDICCKADMDVTAGGRAVEALRSILISQQLLGTREIIIMHHVRQPNPSGETEKKKRGLDHRTRLNRPG
jgi:hypothetical protein